MAMAAWSQSSTFSGMQEIVHELFEARRAEGRRVKELLRHGITQQGP